MAKLASLTPLFVFEMANNHMGDVEHGLRIIREIRQISRDFPFRFGFKLQYRNLDSFIHPDFKNRMDFKYVKRFSETRLSVDQFKRLKDEMTKLSFISVCTPFDEDSVDRIEEHDFDIIKIASCSCTDWPLLERIVKTTKPVIISTAGIDLEDLDRVVSFFDHREKDFALMHCVAEYPTPIENLELNQIDLLKKRYPQAIVGYSTHEGPDEIDSVKIAVAKGAAILEKHVGFKTTGYALNDYSAEPEQVKRWIQAASEALTRCGTKDVRRAFSRGEIESLTSLRRGVFTNRKIKKGERIKLSDVFFAIPTFSEQLTANDMSKYTDICALRDIEEKEPILQSDMKKNEVRQQVYEIIHKVRSILRESHVVIPPKVDLEVSHHYGLDRFNEFGLTMATVVNREYCKKIIVMLQGQKHPEQYHNVKEETFHVLYGDIWLNMYGDVKSLKPGDVVVVERGVKHSFGSDKGAIIEEISSTHFENDSFYTDETIMQNENRKTLLTYWFD